MAPQMTGEPGPGTSIVGHPPAGRASRRLAPVRFCSARLEYVARMEINGVPLHPLVIHAAVVFVPLSVLAVVAFVIPKWRWLVRWPALVVTLAAAVSVQLASMTGDSLKEKVGNSALIDTHEMWAGRLQAATWVLAAVMAVAFWLLPHVTGLRSGVDRPTRVAALEKPVVAILPVLAIAVLVLVVITGDAGAQSVWSGRS